MEYNKAQGRLEVPIEVTVRWQDKREGVLRTISIRDEENNITETQDSLKSIFLNTFLRKLR